MTSGEQFLLVALMQLMPLLPVTNLDLRDTSSLIALKKLKVFGISHYHNSVMLICILALAIIYIFCSFTPVFNNVPIWLDNIGCTSDDTVIENCTKGGYRCPSSCYHYNDVGLSCYRSKYTYNIIYKW